MQTKTTLPPYFSTFFQLIRVVALENFQSSWDFLACSTGSEKLPRYAFSNTDTEQK